MAGVIGQSAAGAEFDVFGSGVAGSPTTVTLTADNTYSGRTYIDKYGILAVPTIANGGLSSPIGASSNSPGNLLFSIAGRGTLLLTGTNAAYSTDRGAVIIDQYSGGLA